MTPIGFDEANKNLIPPAGTPEGEMGDLPVWTDGRECVSLWRPSLRERISILLFGRVWLRVLSGETQPPVDITARRTLFEPDREE